MKKQHRSYYVAVDKEGCGWDLRIGKVLFPQTFVTRDEAEMHLVDIRDKWRVELHVVNAHLSFYAPDR